METLYRGVSEKMHRDGTVFIPKGTTFKRQASYDGTATHDGSLTYGKAEQNAIFYHQVCSGKYPTSGISSTTSFDVAKRYATHNNSIGYVYEIHVCKLEEYNIELYIVSEIIPNMQFPEDDEVILRQKEDHSLPDEIVSSITKVFPS